MKLIHRIGALICLLGLASTLHAQQRCSNYVSESTGGFSSGLFADNGDGTVTHNTTGLMWKRCTEGQTWDASSNSCTGTQNTASWTNALITARNAFFANKGDWRLPNIKELESIVEDKCSDPSINKEVFPNTPTAVFWSSSTYVGNPSFAWGFYFFSGSSAITSKATLFSLRLVRGGGSDSGGNYGAFDSNGGGTTPVAPSCTLSASPGSISSGATSTLSASCSPFATSYIWTGAACSTNSATCTVTPNSTTIYSVAGVNSAGAGNAANAMVTVSTPVPSCTLSATPGSVTAGSTSTLTASCSPSVTSYVWTGASCSSTSSTCTVTPSSTSIYAVAGVNVTGTGAATYTTVSVTAPVAPTCTLSASPGSIAVGASSTLSASCSPAATSYVWTGAACSTTSATCTVTPSSTTIYSVAGVNAVGAGTAANTLVTVSTPLPSCTLSAAPGSIAAGATSTLSASCSPSVTSYVWTGAACSSTSSTCTVTPSVTAIYAVAGVNVTGTGGAAYTTVSVTAPVAPSCTLSASPGSITAGATSTLSASCSPAASSYVWTGAACSSSSSTCAVTPNATTIYSVAGVNAVGTGTSAVTTVSVTLPVAPSCTLSASPGSIAAGATSTLSASCTPAASSYVWTGAACSTTSATCTVTPTATTNYTVAGISASGTGAVASAIVTVTSLTPVCTLTASPASIASGGTSNLTASCSPVAVTFNWSSAGCDVVKSTCSVKPTTTTAYTVAGANGLGTGALATATVTVTTLPVCTVTASPSSVAFGGNSTLTANCSPSVNSYIWTGGTCSGTTAATCSVTPSATTAYTVVGVNALGAGDAATVSVTVTGITPPVCTLIATPTAIQVGGSATLMASCSPAATSYYWMDADCSGVQGASCTVAPKATTSYTVAGINSKGVGTATTATVKVAAAGTPVCALNASPVVVSAGGSANLSVNCQPAATSYTWTKSGFGSSVASGTVNPGVPTVYSVTGSNALGSGNQASAAIYVCNTPPVDNYVGLLANGTGGNDTFYSGIASDTVDGGPGFDSVIYNCNKDSFTITRTTSGWNISSVAEGIDTLANVERIRFGNETLALDISGIAGQAYRIYQAAFNRVPDNGGLKYWIGRMDGGTSLLDVASGFVNSPEFVALYGSNPSDSDFLTRLYSNVLHRAPDPGGYAFWLGELTAGRYNKSSILASFSESPENQAGVIGAILNGIDLLN